MFPVHLKTSSTNFPFFEGFYVVFSIIIGFIVASRSLKKINLNFYHFFYFVFTCIISAIIFGKIFHIIFWERIRSIAEFVGFFKPMQGGTSIIGVIIGCGIGGLIYCKFSRISFIVFGYVITPASALTQGIGRIGCFLNGDAFGKVTNLPWGVEFKRYGVNLNDLSINKEFSSHAWSWAYQHGYVTSDSIHTPKMHPTQLYEAFFDIILACFLYYIAKQPNNKRIVIYSYIFLYSIFRFFIEYIRADREKVIILDTSLIQIFLLLISVIFTILLIYEIKHIKTPAIC